MQVMQNFTYKNLNKSYNYDPPVGCGRLGGGRDDRIVGHRVRQQALDIVRRGQVKRGLSLLQVNCL